MSNLNERIAGLSPEKRALLERTLAESVKAKAPRSPLVRDDSQPLVASLVQQGFWAMEQIEAGTSRLNVGFTLHLQGSLDIQAMEHAFSALVERHDALRSQFGASPEGELQVEICAPWQFALTRVDLIPVAANEVNATVQAAVQAEVNHPFLLDREHLIRGTIYRIGEQSHVLQLTVHHLVIDGWAIGIAFRDLAVLYNSAVTGNEVRLPDLPVRFADFARWHREQLAGPEGKRLLTFWLDHLAGSPKILSLPTDRPRPPFQTFRGDTHTFALSSSLIAAMLDYCQRENVTPFMLLLAAVYSVFAQYTGQNDILVGSPMAARMQLETENIVGCFMNTVVMRGKLDGDPTFQDLLRQIRKSTLDAFAHQDLPFDMLKQKLPIERDASRAPVVQVLVTCQNATIDPPKFEGLSTTVKAVTTNSSKVDLTIELNPVGDGFELDIEFNTDLFDASTIDRLWSHMAVFLERGIAAPEQKVAAISLHTAAQRQQLLVDWNQTQRDYPANSPLASLVEAQVDRTPEAIAVTSGDRQLTFFELNQRANQLAHHLRDLGAGPDQLVGVCLGRSVDLVVALLAIVKAGAAYLPIDPLLPTDRIQYLVKDSEVRTFLTEQSLLTHLTFFSGTTILMEERSWRTNSRENLDVEVPPHSLAYLIYTSGSTGQPKGVQIPRQAFTNFLWSMRDSLQLSETDRCLALTTISFDIAGLEIWLPLLVGARIVLVTREEAADGKILRGLIEQHDISFMQATPITWQLLFLAGWKQKSNLQAICGGEAMPPDLAARLVPAVGRLWNMYGPTETTVWSTGFVVTDAAQPILIGRPIANTRCYILDSQLQPVAIGVTGELYIGGDGLAIGYRNRPELTAAAFVSDPFLAGATRIYRTGDLARFRADGNIECLGRIDHQVKMRGHRIELGEIEAALKNFPEISEAVVTMREDQPGDKRLVAYIVPFAGALPQPVELMRQLKLSLPYYMIPTVYQTLQKLPISPSGKIDRKALPAPDGHRSATTHAHEAPQGPVQEVLARIWAEILEIPKVGIHDDYFELGGDSLRAVRVILRIRQEFPECRPTLATFLRAPTIDLFARTLTGGQADWSCLVPVRDGGARAPFFCVHGAGGNWMSMRALAMAMPSDQPFYCLQARGLDGRAEPFSTVEETAACYIEHIKSVQPHGPYNLGGGCYGGLVAFEMACRLRAMGDVVDVLALIDTHNHAYSRHISRQRLFYFKMSFIVRRTVHHLTMLDNLNTPGRRKYLWKRVKIGWSVLKDAIQTFRRHPDEEVQLEGSAHTADPRLADDDVERILTSVRDASLAATNRFTPRPYSGHMTVFRAKQRPDEPYSDLELGWGPVVFGGITTHQIDADHDDIFENPAVKSVAELLDAELYAKELVTRYRVQTPTGW